MGLGFRARLGDLGWAYGLGFRALDAYRPP